MSTKQWASPPAVLRRADAVLDHYRTGAEVSDALAATTIQELTTVVRTLLHVLEQHHRA